MNQLMKRVLSVLLVVCLLCSAPLCLRGRGRRVHGRLEGPLGV